MAKNWKTVATVGVVLMLAEGVNPGTAAKMMEAGKRTVDPGVDNVADTVNNHVVPAASDTLGAARDGLAETNILGTPEPAPVWAAPQDGG